MSTKQDGKDVRVGWKRRLRCVIGAVLVLAMGTGAGLAQSYPTRQVRLIVPYPAGSGPDEVGRMLADRLGKQLGQSVIVENRAGALGSIGAQEVARSAPDGQTLLLATNTTHAADVAMLRNLPYNPVTDFAPIGRLITTAMALLVKTDFPAHDLPGFVAYAREHKGELTAGYGTGAGQMAIAQLRTFGGIATVAVPYRGVPPAVLDVITGSTSLTFADYAISLAQVGGGQVRALAVTSLAGSEFFPDLPTMAASMPGFNVTIWYGLVAPAHTPAAIVDRLAGLTGDWLALPETKEQLHTIGLTAAFMPPNEFAPFIASEVQRWTADAKAAGIQPE